MATVQVIGMGDKQMAALREHVIQALAECKRSEQVEEVSDYYRVLSSGIFQMPALVVDGQVLAEGTIPSVEEIKRLLNQLPRLVGKLYRMRRIAVGVDLSPASENALLFACKLAHLLQVHIEVVYVMDSIFDSSKAAPSSFLASYRQTMREELEAFIRRAAQQSGVECLSEGQWSMKEGAPSSTSPRMRAQIAFGFPEEVLAAISERVDLLVLGTTGRGGLVRKLFGSVSIEVSRKAKSPVLLIPPQAVYMGFRQILYASHFESAHRDVVAQVLAFARRLGGQVHFVHVSPPGKSEAEQLEVRLREIHAAEASPDHPFRFSRVVGDDIVEALNEYAFDHRIDLFVFATHQRSFWSELLHHSITREMLLHTSMPVLVLHTGDE